MSNIIQSLWIGKELSVMEQMCLSSFVKNGHEVHLYTYDNVKNIPEGVQIKDGNDILVFLTILDTSFYMRRVDIGLTQTKYV